MKKIKVSLLALSVLVGGAVLASAASTSIVGATSDIALTNAPAPLIWYDVYTAPTSGLLTNLSVGPGAFINTDSSGKIDGVASIVKSYTDASNNVVAISSWFTTIKGKISASKMAQPSISMSIKGDGYAAPNTNPIVVFPSQKVDAFPGKLSLNFSAKNAAAISNNFNWHILGSLKGSVTPAVKGAKTEKVDQTADLIVGRNALSELDLRVVVSGTKFAAIASNGGVYGANGTGKIGKGGSYSVNLKDSGTSLGLKGTITTLVLPSNTNNVVTTINTADIKGKVQGQAVESTGYKFAGFDL